MTDSAHVHPTAIRAIAETFERVDAGWVAGTELPSSELEEAIDAGALADDLPALRAALAAYEQVCRAHCRRAEATA